MEGKCHETNYQFYCQQLSMRQHIFPDSKVHGANMWPTWVLPDGPHVGPMILAIRVGYYLDFIWHCFNTTHFDNGDDKITMNRDIFTWFAECSIEPLEAFTLSGVLLIGTETAIETLALLDSWKEGKINAS